jgi:hypothetical protein
MNREDPIVEEARQARQAYIDSFTGDWKALLADLKRKSEVEGRTVVSRLPRRPGVASVPNKKAG